MQEPCLKLSMWTSGNYRKTAVQMGEVTRSVSVQKCHSRPGKEKSLQKRCSVDPPQGPPFVPEVEPASFRTARPCSWFRTQSSTLMLRGQSPAVKQCLDTPGSPSFQLSLHLWREGGFWLTLKVPPNSQVQKGGYNTTQWFSNASNPLSL